MIFLLLALLFIVVLVNLNIIIILIIRYHHSSWASPSGLILLGGRGSKRTTEKIQEDGTSSYSFELKYDLE